jgi:hypothetical protein
MTRQMMSVTLRTGRPPWGHGSGWERSLHGRFEMVSSGATLREAQLVLDSPRLRRMVFQSEGRCAP